MPPFFCINMLKIPVYYAYIIQNELYLACILRVYCTHITIKNLLKPTNTFFKNTHNKTPETLNFRGSFLLISTHPVLTLNLPVLPGREADNSVHERAGYTVPTRSETAAETVPEEWFFYIFCKTSLTS